MKRKISTELKSQVALAAMQGAMTQSEISSKFSVHTTQINRWKKQAMAALPDAFSNGKERVEYDREQLVEELYKEIGKLRVENEWLKKKSRVFEL